MSKLWSLVSILTALASVACGSGAIPRAHAPTLADVDRTTCEGAAAQSSPLLVEWSGAEKANLEASLQRGAVAVEYTGCEMRIVAGCELPGHYVWQKTTTTTDVLQIDSSDELHAQLPLGAWDLEGALSETGRLSVRTIAGGQMTLSGASPRDVPWGGSCAQATHLLVAVSIGAFSLDAGGTVNGSAGANVREAGVGAKTASRESVLRQAGNGTSCSLATSDAPHDECRSPLQAFLAPLPGVTPRARKRDTVQVTFVSSNADLVWEVRRNNETLCTTPCTRWLDPAETFRLRSYGGDGQPSSGGYKIDLPSLRNYSSGQAVHVQAEPRKKGRLALGIVATSIGGLVTLFAGFATLTADDRSRSDTGLKTLGVGAGLTSLGILGIATSGPDVDITEQQRADSSPMLTWSGRF